MMTLAATVISLILLLSGCRNPGAGPVAPSEPASAAPLSAATNAGATPSTDGVASDGSAKPSGGESAEPLVTLLAATPPPAPTSTQPPVILPTPTPSPTAAPRRAGVVTGALVNVRGGPGTAYPILATVGEGTEYPLRGRNEDGSWLQVCCLAGATGEEAGDAETPGWISADLLEVAADGEIDAALPLVEAPPLPTPAAETVTAAASGNQSAPAPGDGEEAARLAAAPAAGLPGDGGFGPPGGTNPLTGQPLAGGRAGQRPVIVCINNDYAARPQFGISQADVMYEYLMEGFGITRFSGVFYGEDVAQIGPVRSARLINYYMAPLYKAGLACSGASDQVRYALKNNMPAPYMDIDLDDPSNTRYSASIGNDYRTRLRTSTDELRRWLADWGVEQAAGVRGFTFGDPPGGGQPATSVSIPYPSGTGSQVSYQYDLGSGRYLRFLGGAAQLDGNTGAQVGVENVVVQFVPHQVTDIVEDSLGSRSIRLNLFGSGPAIIFRDGQAFQGTWRSESQGDTPRFYGEDGSEIPLKPGHTWISVTPLDYEITHQ